MPLPVEITWRLRLQWRPLAASTTCSVILVDHVLSTSPLQAELLSMETGLP